MERSTRISVLISLTASFFFVEIIVGYVTSSISLIADSFHMLSDVMSLVIGFYAIKLASRTTFSPSYSYGWQRAEVLGALANGVFLLALCFTLYIEAFQRFFEEKDMTNPKLVLYVGSAGLVMNIIGLFLFHEHGHVHSHGHGHSHDHRHDHLHDHKHIHDKHKDHHTHEHNHNQNQNQNHTHTEEPDARSIHSSRSRSASPSRSRPSTDLVHPAQARMQIISAAQEHQRRGNIRLSSSVGNDAVIQVDDSPVEVESPDTEEESIMKTLFKKKRNTADGSGAALNGHHHHDHDHSEHDHNDHEHTRQRKPKTGHHGHLNMHGIFLHVLGDALGSVGVIIAALLKIFCEGEWTRYADPVTSLIITTIIVTSTIPLVKSASYILLQGAPRHVELEQVKRDIRALEGVADVHELHIWQLSDTKMIASVHVLVNEKVFRNLCHRVEHDHHDHHDHDDNTHNTKDKTSKPRDYMDVASDIKKLLHEYGIHSTTVQPEFRRRKRKHSTTAKHDLTTSNSTSKNMDRSISSSRTQAQHQESRSCDCNSSINSLMFTDDDELVNEETCLLMCDDTSCEESRCCPPPRGNSATKVTSPNK